MRMHQTWAISNCRGESIFLLLWEKSGVNSIFLLLWERRSVHGSLWERMLEGIYGLLSVSYSSVE